MVSAGGGGRTAHHQDALVFALLVCRFDPVVGVRDGPAWR